MYYSPRLIAKGGLRAPKSWCAGLTGGGIRELPDTGERYAHGAGMNNPPIS